MQGYLPEALLNYLVRLGWSHGDQEIFSLEEMIELFDIGRRQQGGLRLQHRQAGLAQPAVHPSTPTRRASPTCCAPTWGELGIDPAEGAGPDELVVAAQAARAKTLVELAEISAFCYRDFDDYDEGAAKKHLRPVARGAPGAPARPPST